MTRNFLAATLLLFFAAVLPSNAQVLCSTDPTCDGNHHFTGGTNFPYVEVIHHQVTSINAGDAWNDVEGPCGSPTPVPNVRSTGTFNIALRAYLELYTSGIAVGTRYEAQLVLRSATTEYNGGWYARTIRGHQVPGQADAPPTSQQTQGDWFHGYLANMPAGDYSYYLKVRVLASQGTMSFNTRYITALGAPSSYGGGYVNTQGPITVGSSWLKIGETQVTNSSGATATFVAQGYFELTGGNTGDRITVGFGFDDLSSGNHNFEVYVPPQMPTGVHLRDQMPNEAMITLGPGETRRLQMWAKNQSGTTTTLNWVELDGLGYPSTLSNNTVFQSTPIDVRTDTTETQPLQCFLRDQWPPPCPNGPGCGKWTKLATFTPTPAGSGAYVLADAYVEILGHAGEWGTSTGQIAIETVLPSGEVFEIGFITFDIPAGTSQIVTFGDIMAVTEGGATFNLWIRKLQNCGWSGETASFMVGKRAVSVRAIDMSPSCRNPN
jgi:hypothetical protein